MKKLFSYFFKLFFILGFFTFSSCSGLFESYSTGSVGLDFSFAREAGGDSGGSFLEGKILYAYLNGRNGYCDQIFAMNSNTRTIIFENVPAGFYEVYVSVYEIPADWYTDGKLKTPSFDEIHELVPVYEGFGSDFVKPGKAPEITVVVTEAGKEVFTDFESLAVAWNNIIGKVKVGVSVPEKIEYTVNGNLKMTSAIEVGFFRISPDSPALYTPELVLKTTEGACFVVENQGFTVIDGKLTVTGSSDYPITIQEAIDTAIVLDGAGQLECSYVNFEMNLSDKTPGAIKLNGSSSLVCSNVEFTENGSDDAGGAIYLTEKSSAQLTECTFSENFAAIGGAIAVQTEGGNADNPLNTLKIIDCIFESNAAEFGGAIYIEGTERVIAEITGSTMISGNYASKKGGAIYFEGTKSTLRLTGTGEENIDISGNYLNLKEVEDKVLSNPVNTAYGAGIYFASGTIALKDCDVDRNYVLTDLKPTLPAVCTNPAPGLVNNYYYDLYMAPDAETLSLNGESYIHTIITEYASGKYPAVMSLEGLTAKEGATPMVICAYSSDEKVFENSLDLAVISYNIIEDSVENFDLTKTNWDDYSKPFVFADINYWDCFWPAGFVNADGYTPEYSWTLEDGLIYGIKNSVVTLP